MKTSSAQTQRDETVLSAWNVSTKKKGQLAPTLFLAFDCAPANTGIAGTILPMATVAPFAAIGKYFVRQVIHQCQHQPKRLSCTAGDDPVDHGEDFFRTFTLAGGSTR